MITLTTSGRNLVDAAHSCGFLAAPELAACDITKIRVLENGKSYEDFSISIHNRKWTKNFVARLEDKGISENVPVRVAIYKRNKNASRHVTFNASASVTITVDAKRKTMRLNVHDTVMYTDGTHRYNKDLPLFQKQ